VEEAAMVVAEEARVGEAAVMVGEAAVMDLAGEEDTLLSVVVTHLADSTAVALVRDSTGRGDFLPVDFLVAEITAALVTVDTIATFTIVAFAILTGTFSISAAPALDIQITLTITHIRITTTMGI
jgi:hypothetical protein